QNYSGQRRHNIPDNIENQRKILFCAPCNIPDPFLAQTLCILLRERLLQLTDMTDTGSDAYKRCCQILAQRDQTDEKRTQNRQKQFCGMGQNGPANLPDFTENAYTAIFRPKANHVQCVANKGCVRYLFQALACPMAALLFFLLSLPFDHGTAAADAVQPKAKTAAPCRAGLLVI
ncbi:MAG: hypothetical protein ACI4OL_04435, partial [Gemmiger sp.]